MRLPRRYLAAAAGALTLALVLSLTVGRLGRASDEATPVQLERIEAENRKAAMRAAAAQRAESAVSAAAADRAVELREAEQRGASEADATLARFDEDGNPRPEATATER